MLEAQNKKNQRSSICINTCGYLLTKQSHKTFCLQHYAQLSNSIYKRGRENV